MKICIISNLYPPYARGGAEQVVHKMSEELAALGHRIIVITLSPGKKKKKYREMFQSIGYIHGICFFIPRRTIMEE
jgi:glycosyltransferase involved in cell wall biosynthesis